MKGSGTFTGYVTAQSKDQAPKHYELFLCELPYYCIFCSMISSKIFSFLNYFYSSRDGLIRAHDAGVQGGGRRPPIFLHITVPFSRHIIYRKSHSFT